jgi:hypothetical protein
MATHHPSHDSNEPQLAKPGAGLPLFQRLYLRYYLGPFVAKKTSIQKSKLMYEGFIKKIINCAKSIPEAKRSTRVLVMPIAGLEDSSRYWSVNMLLEHLDVVSLNFRKIILALSHNQDPGVLVDVSKVKPKTNDSAILANFKMNAPHLFADILKEVKDLNSKKTHYHPWFGEINLQQWLWLLATHNAIHWKQLKAIRDGL